MPQIGVLKVSSLGLGGNTFGFKLNQQQVHDVVRAAIDSGVNFFDTADCYGDGDAERFLGKAARGRDDIVIATKFGVRAGELLGGGRPNDVRRAVEGSLTRLGRDRIDIYQMHFPASWMARNGYGAAAAPIDETLGALNDLVAEGLVGEIGCSNFSPAELREAQEVAARLGLKPFTSAQSSLSMLDRGAEIELLPTCAELGIAFIPYFPLAAGLLTGKYHAGQARPRGSRLAGHTHGMWAPLVTDENFEKVERLEQLAARFNTTILDLAMSWLLTRPAVASVVAGVTGTGQVQSNALAIQYELSDEELDGIDDILGVPAPSVIVS